MAKKQIPNKKRISITIEENLLKWVDKEIVSKRFGSRSHALEVAIKEIKSKIEKGEKLEY